MAKYVNPENQAFYDRLVSLRSPDALRKNGIFGAILDGFTAGFNGLDKPVYIGTRNSAAIAYRAGVDVRKAIVKANK